MSGHTGCIRLKIENSWWNRLGRSVQIWLTTGHSSFFFPFITSCLYLLTAFTPTITPTITSLFSLTCPQPSLHCRSLLFPRPGALCQPRDQEVHVPWAAPHPPHPSPERRQPKLRPRVRRRGWRQPDGVAPGLFPRCAVQQPVVLVQQPGVLVRQPRPTARPRRVLPQWLEPAARVTPLRRPPAASEAPSAPEKHARWSCIDSAAAQ